MSKKLNVVAVTGSLQRPSRTLALTEAILAQLADRIAVDIKLIELGEIGPSLAGALRRDQLPVSVAEDIRAIETADLLVVATPVYRASFTGLFKHLFDFVHHEALTNVPVLLAATGGSDRHALVIDHQLRPLFSFFQALTLPIGVYGAEREFSDYRVQDTALQARIALAVERALPLLSHREAAVSAAVAA
ncbi:FMN reductase [Chitinolyticbacter meiyuanensis]|uniref:FMN reductase n=1 Tax=Chitinolyticbacter meiyuanensis TaxID=682798 RepID=UPI0011E5B0B9|nr:FMN reductase [Chitinolyticbacter meiyuanensis]